MSFRVRDAKVEDLAAVGQLAGRLVRVHCQYDPARWMAIEGVEEGYERYFASQLGLRGTIILVAEDEGDGQIVGYTYASLEERNWADWRDACARLHDLYIVEKARRKGLARQMVRDCLRRFTELGVPLAVSMIAWQNDASQALLRDHGFRPAVIEMVRELK